MDSLDDAAWNGISIGRKDGSLTLVYSDEEKDGSYRSEYFLPLPTAHELPTLKMYVTSGRSHREISTEVLNWRDVPERVRSDALA